jgi:hypothetical protein
MLFRDERGDTFGAPGAHADVGHSQRWFVWCDGFRGGPSGILRISPEAHRVAVRDHSTRYAFRRYLESPVWQGLWGSDRGGDVAVEFWSDPASAGRYGLRTRGDSSTLSLTSLGRGRATASGAGVSNR